jgi:hypothetical protein
MKLPTRTKQKKSETESLAIVNYKLGDLGIFRGQTENDYGIDLDLELVQGDQVTGRAIKIQVKSAEELKLRKDGTPSVGGIKQSTLRYWCELSFRTSVVAYAVDLATQKIYVTINLFWQASAKIDGGGSSKSIEFLPEGPDNIALAKYATAVQAFQPTIAEVVAAHSMALRRLKQFLMLLADTFHYDAGSPLHEPDDFRDLLQVCGVLLWNDGDKLWSDRNERKRWMRYDYWERKSEKDGWDGISYFAAQPILATLLPALIRILCVNKKRVLAGKFYWSHRDPQYLALVYETTIPDVDDKDGLIKWAYEYDQRARVVTGSGTYFADRARTPALAKGKAAKKT